jgi:hypothetical protein
MASAAMFKPPYPGPPLWYYQVQKADVGWGQADWDRSLLDGQQC